MEFLRAIGPVFNFLLLAGALFFLTRKRIRKLFRDRKERIAAAHGLGLTGGLGVGGRGVGCGLTLRVRELALRLRVGRLLRLGNVLGGVAGLILRVGRK